MLQEDMQQFDDAWLSSSTQVLRIFGSFKEHQSSIEAGLIGYARQRSSPPVAAMTRNWLIALAQAIQSRQLCMDDFELADLETMALGLTACISLGQPNLLTNAGLVDAKVKAAFRVIYTEVFAGFLSLDEDSQHDHPGAVLNIHNLVSRLCKTEAFPADAIMKRASERCFALMMQWSQAWSANQKRGLHDLSASVERKLGDNAQRTIKRAGKAMVQLEMFCDPAHCLLPLASGDQQGDANREALGRILAWLGSSSAIEAYRQAGEEGLVALSSLAHLNNCLLNWNNLSRDPGTGNRLRPLLQAIAELAPTCQRGDQLRALSNFCRLLGTLTKENQDSLWEGASHAELKSACASMLDAVAQLGATEMQVRTANPLLVFLRAMESWLARLGRTGTGDADRRSATATTTTTTTHPRATTTTIATIIDTGKITTHATVPAPTASGAPAGLHRDQVAQAAQQLLLGLTTKAIRAEEKAEHLGALIDALCWLRGIPALVEQVDALLSTLDQQIRDLKPGWSMNHQSLVAGKLRRLTQQGWTPSTQTQALTQELEQAGGTRQPAPSGTPLPLPAESKQELKQGLEQGLEQKQDEAEAQKDEIPDPWSGSIVGDRPLAIQRKQQTAQTHDASQDSAPRYVPLARPRVKTSEHFAKVHSGPKPQVIVSRPIATVVVEADETADSNSGRARQQADRKTEASPSRRVKARARKRTSHHRIVNLSADEARAAKERARQKFENDLQEASSEKTKKTPARKKLEWPAVGQEPEFGNRIFPELTEALRQPPFIEPIALTLEVDGLRLLSLDLRNRVLEMERQPLREPVRQRLLEALKASANAGNASAQYYLGLAYWQGRLVKQDLRLAVEHLRAAVEDRPGQGEIRLAQACYAAALTMLDARDDDVFNSSFSPTRLTHAVDNSHPAACHMLGMEYELGRVLKRSTEHAIACWKKGADLGDAQSMVKLGLCLARGHGVQADAAAANYWLNLALQKGVSQAEAWLKDLPSHASDGVHETFAPAVPTADTTSDDEIESQFDAKLTERSISLKEVRAQIDFVEPVTWSPEEILSIQKAAAKGEVEAIVLHGKWLHHQGKHSLAFDHFFRAASLGSANAQYLLGNYRRLGLGTWVCDTSAFECYTKALEKGHPRALLALGYCYETATGIKRDLARARDFYARAKPRSPEKAPDQQ